MAGGKSQVEFSLIGPMGLPEEPARAHVAATVEGPSSREIFISRCTSQSLVVWRLGTPFGAVQPRSVDRVHSPSREDADAPVADHLARPALVESA